MIQFARRTRSGAIDYIESTEVGEIIFDASMGAGSAIVVAAFGVAGVTAWAASLAGFITARRLFSVRIGEACAVEERTERLEEEYAQKRGGGSP